MSKDKRNGNRIGREQAKKRIPNLGYYYILTDTEETEKNYINGLRDSIPESLKDNLVIKVNKSKTGDLVKNAMNQAALDLQYREVWIIFDRDQVKNFDEIIHEAENNNIHVGWSNPCIEIWFHAYFGSIPVCQNSVKCCDEFKKCFKKNTGKEYRKSDQKIYQELCSYGDEKKAIQLAEAKLKECIKNGEDIPSKMMPCTTVHLLVKEIQTKII